MNHGWQSEATDLSIYLSTYLSVCLSVFLSVCLSISSVYLTVYLGIYLSTSLPIYLSIDLSIIWIYLSTLWDFFIFPSWQHQKRSTSARLPHFLKLTTSNGKQFCETFSFFEVDNIKNEAILRDFLHFELNNVKNEASLRDFFIFHTWQHQKRSNSARLPSKMESWLQSWRPRTNAFCDFCCPPV